MGKLKDALTKRFAARRKVDLPAPSERGAEQIGEVVETRVEQYAELTGDVPDGQTITEISEQATANVLESERVDAEYQAEVDQREAEAAAIQADIDRSRRSAAQPRYGEPSSSGGPIRRQGK